MESRDILIWNYFIQENQSLLYQNSQKVRIAYLIKKPLNRKQWTCTNFGT
jgi:hypothetical protein